MKLILLNLAGNEVATVEVDHEQTLRDLEYKIHGVEPIPSTGTLGEAGLEDGMSLNIKIRDVGVAEITGIPEDATFGGHGSATGSVGDAGLAELNGEWKPVPLLEVNGHPVWQRQTKLCNRNGSMQPMEGDDGMRYLKLDEDGVIDICWLKPGSSVAQDDAFKGQKERHGYINCSEDGTFKDTLDTGWSDVTVCLALKESASFPNAHPYNWRLGRNTVAGRAQLSKGKR
eukprot:TRINITY_DN68826_c0_g1_i1.p1 TRINITY_DN68826_c0_g1~~TRINITY_DN68826_c0_g1_i1.p1  ORF type:complete len:229 (+),score=40.11 TRINITY_DN68826_c0_g1_i1:54-740(+)